MIIPISQDTNKFYISIAGGDPQVFKKLIYNDSQVQNVVVWADYYSQYFTIESQANENEISLYVNKRYITITSIEKSLDGGVTWTTPSTQGTSNDVTYLLGGPTTNYLNNGEKVLVRIVSNYLGGSSDSGSNFKFTKNTKIYGNIMSLLYGSNFEGQDTLQYFDNFNGLFKNCTTLTDIVNLKLPATTLSLRCYGGMFEGCTSITRTMELPATNLAQSCYSGMFTNCTALTEAPLLPAIILAQSCYSGMFTNCTSLVNPPILPATTLAKNCYYMMFYYCTSLTVAPELPASVLEQGCYNRMFDTCRNLLESPELPAQTLTTECYKNMFQFCRSLVKVTCLATDISATDCLTDWLYYIPSSGTFYKDSTMSSWPSGTSGIPTNWTTVNYN